MGAMDRRPVELGRFLRNRRERLTPRDEGVTRTIRRTRGLRREEVANRANVSVSWYVHLEQGRKVQPSVTVLDSLAAALELNAVEHAYLHALAAPAALPASVPSTGDAGSSDIARALVELHAESTLPVFAVDGAGDVVAANEATGTWYGLAERSGTTNFAEWLYTDPAARERILNWREVVKGYTAVLRFLDAVSGDPEHRRLLEQLAAVSSQFRLDWESRDVLAPGTMPHTFAGPHIRPVTLDVVAMRPTASSTRVMFHLPSSRREQGAGNHAFGGLPRRALPAARGRDEEESRRRAAC